MQQNLNAFECISPKDKDTNVFLLIVAQFFPYTGPNSKIHSPRNPDYVPQNIHPRIIDLQFRDDCVGVCILSVPNIYIYIILKCSLMLRNLGFKLT